MAQIKLGGGRLGGKSRKEGEKEKLTFREEGDIGSKSREEGEKEKLTFREEGESGSESREKGDLPSCSTPLPSGKGGGRGDAEGGGVGISKLLAYINAAMSSIQTRTELR